MSQTSTREITVETIRKLALPLSTHIISGEGLLDRAVTWATVIHPEDDIASRSVQEHELILFAPVKNPSKARSASELVHWSAKNTGRRDCIQRCRQPDGFGRGQVLSSAGHDFIQRHPHSRG